MDPVYITPLFALGGVLIGSLTTGLITYFIQHGVEDKRQVAAKKDRIRKAYSEWATVCLRHLQIKDDFQHARIAGTFNMQPSSAAIHESLQLLLAAQCNVIFQEHSEERRNLTRAMTQKLRNDKDTADLSAEFQKTLSRISDHIEHAYSRNQSKPVAVPTGM